MNVSQSKMHVITSVSTQKGLIIAVVARDIPWEMTIKPVEVTSFLSLSHLLKLATIGIASFAAVFWMSRNAPPFSF